MIRLLLPLLMTMVVCAEPPQEKAVAPPALTTAAAKKDAPPVQEKATTEKAASDKPEPNKPNPEVAAPGTSTLEKNGDTPASRMQSSLEKQRASARRQASPWISVGEPQSPETFVLPWPKAAVPATTIALRSLRTMIDSAPCDPVPESELDQIVNNAAGRQKVSPRLVKAIIAQESGGRPCAVSPAGAQGLMQLMPDVQRDLAVADPFDPMESVEAGAKLLRTLIDRYAGDLPKALAAYNAGPGAVDRAGGIPPIPETTNYVSKIVKKIE